MDNVDSRYRWWICALLFAGTTICYLDRQVIGLLKTTLQGDQRFDDQQYAHIVFWFQAAYAAGYLFAGRLNDILRVRRGYALAVAAWSIAAVAHSVVRTVTGFSIARVVLGLAEGGNFPAAIRSVSEWFPRKERALATGIFNSGSSAGVILSSLTVPWITLRFGWPTAFAVTGALGFLWLIPWLMCYRQPADHPRVSKAELAHIQADPADSVEPVPWLSLLKHRSTWAYALGTALSSPIWWFYLFWVPDFLLKNFHFDLKNIGWPLVIVYLLADVGSVGGGWISSTLIKRGSSVNRARKIGPLTCALCVVPVVFTTRVANPWIATLLIGLAAAGHQGWSANLYTFASDTTPRKAVSSLVGMGGMAEAPWLECSSSPNSSVGILKLTHSYLILFAIAPCAYLLALIAIQVLVPTIREGADAC